MGTIILKILILGGTSFLGPHLVEEAQQRGHEITLFNRGTQESSRFPQVEKLRGDRDGHLEALQGREWDAVIDTSGHVPRIVEASSKLLANSTPHYTFISSISVYENFNQSGIEEDYPLAQLDNPDTEEITEKTYGALKARCEQVVEQYFPVRSLIVRPGLIVGPDDPTDRFTYWPCRVRDGGDILAPVDPTAYVQFIDVRDLSKWIIDMIEEQATGVYNVVGEPIAFETLVSECQKVTQSDATIHWVSEDFLIEHQVGDWVELPLWLSSQRKIPGFLHISSKKACGMGLASRPLAETISATLEWNAKRQNVVPKAGLNREQERKLLELWQKATLLRESSSIVARFSLF